MNMKQVECCVCKCVRKEAYEREIIFDLVNEMNRQITASNKRRELCKKGPEKNEHPLQAETSQASQPASQPSLNVIIHNETYYAAMMMIHI